MCLEVRGEGSLGQIRLREQRLGTSRSWKGVNETTMVFEEANESTNLWHHFLGHMREKGLKVLIKHKLVPYLKSMNLNFYMHCVF
jgi:hypothetical protein